MGGVEPCGESESFLRQLRGREEGAGDPGEEDRPLLLRRRLLLQFQRRGGDRWVSMKRFIKNSYFNGWRKSNSVSD